MDLQGIFRHGKGKQFTTFICPPPWPEAKEKSFAEQMNFLGLRLGGWAFNF